VYSPSAFDARTRSARELLRQVQAKRFVKANPKLKIDLEIHNRPDAPTANFHFVDGTEVNQCIVLLAWSFSRSLTFFVPIGTLATISDAEQQDR